jgi:hypothetical protein
LELKIPANWEAEIEELRPKASLGIKVTGTLFQKQVGYSDTCPLFQLCRRQR